jgi:hypothetical protein
LNASTTAQAVVPKSRFVITALRSSR